MPNFDFNQWEEAYRDAPVEREGSGDVPDGNYQVRVARVEMTESKKGSPMLAWELDIINGAHAGRKLWRNNVIASYENVKYLKVDLHTAGLTLQKLSDLNDERNLRPLIGVTLEVTKKTKGENKNVYINRRIALASAPRAAATMEDVPF